MENKLIDVQVVKGYFSAPNKELEADVLEKKCENMVNR